MLRAVDGDREFLCAERAPHRGVAPDFHAEPFDLGDEFASVADLRVGAVRIDDRVALRDLFEVLSARRGALVDDRHGGAAQRRGARRRQARGTGADNEHLRAMQRRRGRCHAHCRRGDGGGIALRGHCHAVGNGGHAGTQAWRAIDVDDAFLAHTHSAPEAARRAVAAATEVGDAGGSKRGGNGFALIRTQCRAVEPECDRGAGRSAGSAIRRSLCCASDVGSTPGAAELPSVVIADHGRRSARPSTRR